MNSPTDSKIVSSVLESAKQILGKSTVKKEPISVDIQMAMINRLYEVKNQKIRELFVPVC